MIPDSKRSCVVCGKALDGWRKLLYCGATCSNNRYKRTEVVRAVSQEPVSSGTRGAVSELVASCDLMERGFHVFRAMSPSSCCDLIAVKGGLVFMVEVRSASINRSSRVWYMPRTDRDHCHFYAFVSPDGIRYVVGNMEHAELPGFVEVP